MARTHPWSFTRPGKSPRRSTISLSNADTALQPGLSDPSQGPPLSSTISNTNIQTQTLCRHLQYPYQGQLRQVDNTEFISERDQHRLQIPSTNMQATSKDVTQRRFILESLALPHQGGSQALCLCRSARKHLLLTCYLRDTKGTFHAFAESRVLYT